MGKKPGHPKRQKKSDRILFSGQTQEQVMCDFALAPLDRLAIDMDRKWGIDMLPELVDQETAVKYGSAMAKLNEAIYSDDPELVKARAAVCMRGLAAMDAKAEQAGAQRAPVDVWQVEADNGVVYGVMKDGRSWQAVQDGLPGVRLVTMREVAVALEFFDKHGLGQMVQEAKKHFDGAEIVKAKLEGFENGNQEDDIPW